MQANDTPFLTHYKPPSLKRMEESNKYIAIPDFGGTRGKSVINSSVFLIDIEHEAENKHHERLSFS